jgi:ABC-type taurine transport system ATPase subunit
MQIPVENPALIGLDLPLTALVGVTRRKMKILTCTQRKQKPQKVKV